MNDLTKLNTYFLALSKGYGVQYETKSGLYMLASINSPSYNPTQQDYLIKIGLSTNLHKRIMEYKGMNPYAICIATKRYAPRFLKEEEEHWHNILSIFGQQIGNTEWYKIPYHIYIFLVTNGFDDDIKTLSVNPNIQI